MCVQEVRRSQVEPCANLGYADWLRYQGIKKGILRIDRAIDAYLTGVILTEVEMIRQMSPEIVQVHISSPGGGAYSAFAIYDSLRHLAGTGTRIRAIVEGMAASAAAMIILQAADERLSRQSARFLIHECRRWVFFAQERTSDLKDEVVEMEKLTERILQILSSRCSKTPQEIQTFMERKEIWMSAQEAKDWGLIDGII